MEPREPHLPVRFGVFELHPTAFELRRGGRRIRLERRPMELLIRESLYTLSGFVQSVGKALEATMDTAGCPPARPLPRRRWRAGLAEP